MLNMNRKTIKIGDIGRVSMCKRVLKHQTSEFGDIPFYKISTFGDDPDVYISQELYNEYREKYSFPKKGDVLISAAGTIGRTVVYDGSPAYFQDSNIVWIENDESIITNSYLYYFYQTEPWLTTEGSTIKRLYNDNLKSIAISYPDLPLQNKITGLLSSFDTKLDLNKRINLQLAQIAKLFYDYWFVQYDFPDKEGKPYKSRGGKMVWNEELKREIPEHWKVESLENVAKIIMGQSPKGSSYNSEGIGTPLINGAADYSGLLLTPQTYTTAPTRICKQDDLVFCIRATIGNLTIADKEYCMGRGVSAVRPLNVLHYSQIYYHLQLQIEIFNRQAVGSVIVGITKDDLTKSKIVVPPDNISRQFEEMMSPMFNKQKELARENQSLSALRDWLLPMLMNGQVTVKN